MNEHAPPPLGPARQFRTFVRASILTAMVTGGLLLGHNSPPPQPVTVSPVLPAPRPIPASARMHVSLIYDPMNPAHQRAVAGITADAALAGRLSGLDAEWYVLDLDTAKVINLDKKFGVVKPPLLVVQTEWETTNPRVYPAPPTSADVLSIVESLRAGGTP